MSWDDFRLAATALQIEGYSDYVPGPGVHSIMVRDLESSRFLSGQTSSLRSLLGEVRNLKCQEGHDKVFSLFSLISQHTAARLPLLYATTVSDLYADTARACIAEDGHLAVLGELELRTERSGMPSWVPDWREKSPCRIMLNAFLADHQPYRSAGSTKPLMRPSRYRDTLIIHGRLIAPIKRILHMHGRLSLDDTRIPGASRDLESLRWSPAVWEGIYRGAVSRYRMPVSIAQQPEYGDACSFPVGRNEDPHGLTAIDMLVHALRQTVTADLYPRPHGRLTENTVAHRYPAYAAWQAKNFEGYAPASVLHEHNLAVKETMINRVAFIAGEHDDAYLGIGLRTIE